MDKVILDTSVAIGLLKGKQHLVAKILPIPEWYIPVAVSGELLYGAWNSARQTENLNTHRLFIGQTKVIPADNSISERYAQIRYQLKTKGRPIPENDIWIAATAIEHDIPLATLDKHFEFVNDLKLLQF